MENKGLIDKTLLVTGFILICVGVYLVYAASIDDVIRSGKPSYFQLQKHVISIVVAICFALVCGMVPTDKWKKIITPIVLMVLISLIVVLIFGRSINGSKRWLNLGLLNVQPTEFLKFFWIIYFSCYCSSKVEALRLSIKNTITLCKNLITPVLLLGFCLALVILQPDLGSVVVVVFLTILLLLTAGARLTFFFIFALLSVILSTILIITSPYRMGRVTSFLDPWADINGKGYQLSSSLMGFARGSLYGVGPGNSYQKLGYMPESHTDFITAIAGEEFGLVGMIVLILLEFIIVARCLQIGIRILKEDAIAQGYMSIGFAIFFAAQTFINIGAASGGIPTKGLTLPLVSYGGSSMMICIAALAVVMRIDYEWKNKVIQKNRNIQRNQNG